jgi:hypothetical protein
MLLKFKVQKNDKKFLFKWLWASSEIVIRIKVVIKKGTRQVLGKLAGNEVNIKKEKLL